MLLTSLPAPSPCIAPVAPASRARYVERMDSDRKFDPAERAAEKARSRAEDERALASGATSRGQLSREHSRIVLRNARMVLSKSERLS